MGAGGTNEGRPLYFNFVLVLSIFSLCYCNITSQFSNYFHRGFYLSLSEKKAANQASHLCKHRPFLILKGAASPLVLESRLSL